jgi:formylglycine-generating enzyme required for sulfatase activity
MNGTFFARTFPPAFALALGLGCGGSTVTTGDAGPGDSGEAMDASVQPDADAAIPADAPTSSTDGPSTDAVSDSSSAAVDAADGGDGGDAGDGGGAQPPSCAASGAGLTGCGTAAESCCARTGVASGIFFRTYTNTGSGPTGEGDPATVSAFNLDKYPVTVGRFRRFVAAWNSGAGWSPPPGSGKHVHLNGGKGLTNSGAPGSYEPGWVAADDANLAPTTANLTSGCSDPAYATWTAAAGSQESLPINCVNWYEAYAFCIWDGGFLPSEAEQEYAAAGGSQEREYPWGATSPGTSSQYANYGCYYPNGSGSCTGVTNIAPVGTASGSAGLWGQLDLAGGVFTWGLDWYAGYAACTDCAYLTPATSRAGRGGFFNSGTTYLAPTYRLFGTPGYRGHGNGFRCARVP